MLQDGSVDGCVWANAWHMHTPVRMETSQLPFTQLHLLRLQPNVTIIHYAEYIYYVFGPF